MILRPLLSLVAGAWLAAATSHDRKPLQSLDRIESAVIQTPRHTVNSLSRFDLDFTLPDVGHSGRRIRLRLEPNHDVVASGASVTYLNNDGTVKASKPIQKHEYKIYKGLARSQKKDGSWSDLGTARISMRKDGLEPLFEGTFAINHDYHHIQTRSNYLRTKQALDPWVGMESDEFMVYFRDSDTGSKTQLKAGHTELKRGVNDYSCNADQLSSNWNPLTGYYEHTPDGNSSLGKRQNPIDTTPGAGNTGGVDLSTTIGQTSGCPSTRKVALVGVAADCGYASQFASTEDVNNNIITNMNSASAVFESAFNISLGIQNITVMPTDCPGTASPALPWNQACSDSVDIQQRLNLFSGWRNTLQDGNSHWTLLTACNTGTEVGLAWVGSACMTGTAGSQAASTDESGNTQEVAGANVVAMKGGTEWQVIAHETGHVFGAVHDCDSSTCTDTQYVASGQCCPSTSTTCNANAQYIMNPYTTSGVTHFSPCTIGNICSAMGRNVVHTSCLSDNRAVQTITGQQCGNGIVEEGEQCDCGDEAACASDPCCNGSTCQFADNAVCDDANEDCCTNCQFSTAGTVCRASTSTCDPEETCPGSSAICPPDETAPDGQSCDMADKPDHVGALQCASGQCTSRNLQCVNVMGTYTNGNNDTYACDDDACTLRCGSPAFGANTCYEMQQNLVDGTSCGGGGHCSAGRCVGSSLGKEALNWIDEHKSIVIGVAVAVGVLLLVGLLSCICGCFKRRSRSTKVVPPKPMAQQPNAGWYAPSPFPPQGVAQQQQYPPRQGSANQGTWGHDSQQHGWRPTPPRTPTGPPPQQQGLYGSGILGSRDPYAAQPPPQPPPPSYWRSDLPGSARYA